MASTGSATATIVPVVVPVEAQTTKANNHDPGGGTGYKPAPAGAYLLRGAVLQNAEASRQLARRFRKFRKHRANVREAFGNSETASLTREKLSEIPKAPRQLAASFPINRKPCPSPVAVYFNPFLSQL
ncbi:MAG: hypothetical protein LBI96_07595 [Odoribacteraceae bacterium]|jgi:hypothetical protein|nr:hypothetical protein [Odoribacteraceae bacterium]